MTRSPRRAAGRTKPDARWLAGLLLVVGMAGATSPAWAGRPRHIQLWDRLGDFSLVVVGPATDVRVEPAGEPNRFVVVATVRVEEVLKGGAGAAGREIEVRWVDPTEYRPMAEIHARQAPRDRAIWVLQRESGRGAKVRGPEYRLIARNVPGDAGSWQPYLQHIRGRAASFKPWEGVELEVSVDPGEVVPGLPRQATVWLSARGADAVTLPDGLDWEKNVRVELEPVPDGFRRVAVVEETQVEPGFQVHNARDLVGTGIPRELPAGAGVGARLLLAPLDVRVPAGETQTYRCVARLVDEQSQSYLSSPAILLDARGRAMSAADEEARAAIVSAHVWPLAGPHALDPPAAMLESLRTILGKHGGTVYGPSLRAGLAFTRSAMDETRRISELKALLSEPGYGFENDVRLELARLYLKRGQTGDARRLYADLLKAEPARAWRAAIEELDPDWKREQAAPQR